MNETEIGRGSPLHFRSNLMKDGIERILNQALASLRGTVPQKVVNFAKADGAKWNGDASIGWGLGFLTGVLCVWFI
jgi:hypothetical protein